MATSYAKLLKILKAIHRVKSHKETNGGLVALRKHGYWHYFRYDATKSQFSLTGTTLHFEK